MSVLSMHPECLPAYITFLENYLKKQMFMFEQKYRDLDENYKIIMKNYDIQMYTLRIIDTTTIQEESEIDEEIRDDNLLKRIEQYNRIAKPNKSRDKDKNRRNRRNGEGEEGKPKRKVRTTITPAKLQEMNKIFKQYLQNQEKSRDLQDQEGLFSVQSDKQAEYGSLKLIGQRLGLGYSTILHKFREYRATRKVKGGALIASINQKRKYKKSREIEQLIERSLSQSTFYTAVQLSKYIQAKYNKTLSRSIISRHLGEMGYSYKNIKTTKPVNRNTNQIKQHRRNFAVALSLQRERHFAQVYFLDQFILTFDEINKKLHQADFEEDSMIDVHITLFASLHGIIKYKITTSRLEQQEFCNFLKSAQQHLSQQYLKSPKIVVMDMDNPIHFAESVIKIRSVLKEQNIRIFYQPPYSQQLNLIEWFFMEVKRILTGRSFQSINQFRQHIYEIIGYYSVTTLQNYFRETENYIKRSMIMQNF